MENKFNTPFIVNAKNCNKYLESNNGMIVCHYAIIPHYYIGIIKSKDRTRVKEHVVLFNDLKELEDYIEKLSK